MTKSILVITHGHQDFSAGGGEVAAYQLFKALGELPSRDNVYLLARYGGGEQSGAINMFRKNEYIWKTGISDWFKFKSSPSDYTSGHFSNFIKFINPDVVFVHHFAHMGIEIFDEIRRSAPLSKIILTFHEFLAICNHNGQMVKTRGNGLCYSDSLPGCSSCFPEYKEEDFWLRKHYIISCLRAVDEFVTPSSFLKERYVNWGIPAERISVIENGQPEAAPIPPRPLLPGETRNRFAFFGQVTPYKGVDVLLTAVGRLSKAQRKTIHVEIHGANLEGQDSVFRSKIESLREPLIAEGVLHWPGPYHRNDLPRRLAKIDWLIVPSVWWENSPVVIQEAFRFRRPVICSNIGGMAEHVRDGIDGLHVGVGNTADWGDTLLSAASDVDAWSRIYKSMKEPLNVDSAASAYMKLAFSEK